jgi:peptidyl-prolyl cis-trans isomerase B (cyclophilin B)
MEDGSQMKGELYPDIAPITVENFVKLCEDDFYAGLIFHRVIPGFMIQGGGYDEDLNPRNSDSIKGEFTSNGVENTLKHTRGVISMARTSDPNSANSQFFIMQQDAAYLDGQYAAFGKITEGLDVIDKIATTPTETISSMFANIPIESQVIKTIRIEE